MYRRWHGRRGAFRSLSLWVFGYGSLIWRPSIPFDARVPGRLHGYVRRFWQGSTDHRGVPGAPGRVVTVLEDPGGFVAGVCYRVPANEVDRVLARLDHREKGGYDRRTVAVHTADGAIDALLYLATTQNPNYLGPATIDAIAEQVMASTGPSGPNDEYVLELARALEAMGESDDHVAALAQRIRASQDGPVG